MDGEREAALLTRFGAFLRERVAPRAAELDRDRRALAEVFTEFGDAGYLTVRLPEAEGGSLLSDRGYAAYRIELARFSGALSFLQAQHQVAMTWLTRAPDQDRARPIYRDVIAGDLALGIGFLSPRHQPLDVEVDGDSFVLSGELPWVTGHRLLGQVVTSFPHDGHRNFIVLPFEDSARDGGTVTYSDPVPLVVFDALDTVRATLSRWRVPRDQVFLSRGHDVQEVPERHNSIYTLAGACRGLQDLVGERADLPAGMRLETDALAERLDHYVETIMEPGGTTEGLRAQATRLVQDWGTLARWAYGGTALLRDHPVNRLIRESWQYSVTAVRPGDIEAIYPSD